MKALTTMRTQTPGLTKVAGRAVPHDDMLQSPASGTRCVYWRLRIFELVAPSLELVHEVSSDERFQIEWLADPEGPVRRVVVGASAADIRGVTSLHREHSPGANAITRMFGLCGRVSVEEMILPANEVVEAEGILLHGEVAAAPFRTIDAPVELVEAQISVPARLRPVRLIPWAIGAGALLLGAFGGVTSLLRQLDQPSSLYDGLRSLRIAPQPEVGRQVAPRPRWP